MHASPPHLAVVTPQSHSAAGTSRPRRGFSLTELLVVIGIIVLLVGLLLTALGVVRKKSDRTHTEAVMHQFANACVAFQAEHGRYPGVIPEEVLAAAPAISSTENALLDLNGGYRVLRIPDENGTPAETDYNAFGTPATTVEYIYPYGPSTWKLKVDVSKIGEGPVIDGKAYPPYFTPDASDLVAVAGQKVDPVQNGSQKIPDLVDRWGQPILYFRQARPRGPICAAINANPKPQFYWQSNLVFLDHEPAEEPPAAGSTPALGELGQDQTSLSILMVAPDRFATLAKFLVHPTVDNTARGAFCLISAGPDGVYFSRFDGAGSQSAPVNDIVTNGNPDLNNIRVVEEYDDVRIFGGG